MFSGMHYVYQVYKARSFSKAAQQLFISQPALSASVKRIEERIGYPIFDRSSKPLSITECGAKYIAAIEEIMAVEQEFTDYLNEWQEAHVGSLTIGGTSLFSALVLPPIMARFSALYPNICLTLEEASTGKLEEKLQKGEIDVLIDNDELDDRVVERQLFFQEYLLLAVPEHYPINQELVEYQLSLNQIRSRFEVEEAPIIPLELFQQEAFILQKADNDTGRRARKICRQAAIEPRVLLEVDQQLTAYMITASGMGISFVGDLLILGLPTSHSVTYYKVGTDYARRNVYAYWKRGRYVSRAMAEFLSMMKPAR